MMAQANKRRWQRFSNGLSFGIIVAILAIIFLWDLIVHTTPVGHASVVWHRLSWDPENISQGPLDEGVHITSPWDKFYTYDVRLQTYDQVYEVVSRDGLHMELTLTFRWRAIKDNIVELNTNIGPNYLETLLIPMVGSVAREVISRHDAEKLYSVDRAKVQSEIYERMVDHDYPNGIGRRVRKGQDNLVVLEDTLVKAIRLPNALQVAIEHKLEQAQRVEEYKFRVETEKLESARKKIEGEGIREFQEIVSPAISESYLRWRGIEATLELANSNNAKVVVIGNSETGLPLILDTTSQEAMLPPPSGGAANQTPPFPVVLDTVQNGDGEVVTVRPNPELREGHLENGDPSGQSLFSPVEGSEGATPSDEYATGNRPVLQ
ncbi:MAG: prohibitin family protein [Sulfitobacter sp.]